MKNLIVLCCLLISLPEILIAQTQSKWAIGVSAGYGQSFYKRNYALPELPPGAITDFRSNYSWSTGMLGERHISPNLSALVSLNYTQIDVPVNTLCNCSMTGSVWLQDEKHHWGSLRGSVRYYVNPKSKINLFVDGMIKANWFIAASEKRDDNHITYWNAMGYKRLVPTVSGAIGLKWKRIALMAEYDANVGRAFVRQADDGVKSSIWRQGLMVKGVFSVFK